MVRVKRGTTASKRRKNVLKQTKGFRWGRKSKFRLAKDALQHAWQYAYRDRKVRKREFRKAWQARINSASRKLDFSYSKLINAFRKNKVELDRKVLAQLIEKEPAVFEKIVQEMKKEK